MTGYDTYSIDNTKNNRYPSRCHIRNAVIYSGALSWQRQSQRCCVKGAAYNIVGWASGALSDVVSRKQRGENRNGAVFIRTPFGKNETLFHPADPLKKPKAVTKAEAAQESENVPKQISEADFHAKTDAKEEQKENAVWKTLEKAADRIKALGNLPGFIGRAIRKIYLTIREIYDRIKEWNRFVARTLLLQQTKRLLKHIAPVKIRGNLHFGFADPSVTGNTLAAIALFYPVLPKKLFIVPDFQNKILEGELDFKGRIYGIILVIVFCKIWFNKDIQRFRKKSRRSKK